MDLCEQVFHILKELFIQVSYLTLFILRWPVKIKIDILDKNIGIYLL